MKIRLFGILVFTVFLLLATSVVASYREVTEPTSINSLDITLEIPDYLRVVPNSETHGWVFYQQFTESASQNICVYTNGSSQYRITFLGDTDSGNNFVVSDGRSALEYTVVYNDGVLGGRSVLPGGTSRHYVRMRSGFQCDGGVNANVTIEMKNKKNTPEPYPASVGILTMQVASE